MHTVLSMVGHAMIGKFVSHDFSSFNVILLLSQRTAENATYLHHKYAHDLVSRRTNVLPKFHFLNYLIFVIFSVIGVGVFKSIEWDQRHKSDGSIGWFAPLPLNDNQSPNEAILTTKNSSLSTRWFPSVSNMLNAILNPDFGSANETNRLLASHSDIIVTIAPTYLSILKVGRDILCTKWFLKQKRKPKLFDFNFHNCQRSTYLCRVNFETFSMNPFPMKALSLLFCSHHLTPVCDASNELFK